MSLAQAMLPPHHTVSELVLDNNELAEMGARCWAHALAPHLGLCPAEMQLPQRNAAVNAVTAVTAVTAVNPTTLNEAKGEANGGGGTMFVPAAMGEPYYVVRGSRDQIRLY